MKLRRDAKIVFVVCGVFIAVLTIITSVGWSLGYRYNNTASYPLGIWKMSPGDPQKGDLVFFRPPEDNPAIHWAREVGILHWQFGHSNLMIKRIVAIAGDDVQLADSVFVNGLQVKNSHVYRRDQAGREIPSVAHSGIVPLEKVWLMSDYADLSFDSRYFGPVDRIAILALARPIFTW